MPIASPKPIRPGQTWTTPKTVECVETPQNESAMWTAPISTHQRTSSLFSNVKVGSIKRTPSKRSEALEKIESDTFWQPSAMYSDNKDWIRVTVTSVSPFPTGVQLWSPPIQRAVPVVDKGLWIKEAVEEGQETAMFTNPHGSWTKAKRAPSPLKGLESREMWRPRRELPSSFQNWLC